MEYVYEGRIVREINELIEEKFNSPDNTKTEEELYNECYEEVIQLYADYLNFDIIGYLNPKTEFLDKVHIIGLRGIESFDRKHKHRDYCFLTIGTKVYQTILEYKTKSTEDSKIYNCDFTLYFDIDTRDLPRYLISAGKYKCEAIKDHNMICFEYTYIPEEEIF